METAVTFDASGLGLPVEIGRIDKELGKLWDSSDDTKTRASLINFVIHTGDPAALKADTEIISTIAAKHACRAILIFSNPSAPTPGAQAWINAHCHQTGKGDRQLCSEQITFRLDGESAHALPNIVFSHLDSDLPLCLWWQGELPEPLNETLWAWVDRLIYDSAVWKNPTHEFSMLRHLSAGKRKGTILCDLNCTRLQPWRYALASLFDHAAAFPKLARVESIEIDLNHHNSRTSALLLLGWFACQLNWTASESDNEFLTADGRKVAFTIRENGSHGRNSALIRCEGAEFELLLEAESDFFEAAIRIPGTVESRQILPATRRNTTDTLLAELSRAGRHPLYTKSLEKIFPLLVR
ncbi:MAG: glucose-6-phosphate dehydrogenase assembly protein OpcA [Spartobacteria bacterium]